MREIYFLRKNKGKWEKFENILSQESDVNPDDLSELYIDTMADLSYARTFYPKSKTTIYLNQLTSKLHRAIYRNKREESSRIRKFWISELPRLNLEIRKPLLIALIVFMFGMAVGMLSAAYDDTFVRLIMGDRYVNMTLANIEKGDPLAVYKTANEIQMFFGITINNIKVSFYAFIMGLLFSVGTGYVLFNNGVMVGAFMYFFIERGLFWESFGTIFIHGALELTAIVLAGAAGFILGAGFMFPGTYTRMESFTRGAKKGLKVVVGLIPIFIIAGFLESFVTRHNQISPFINYPIIILSFAFLLFYYILYPLHLQKKDKEMAMALDEGIQK
jgi:uncharacterized membrane protein SpoIIM required for sporulation